MSEELNPFEGLAELSNKTETKGKKKPKTEKEPPPKATKIEIKEVVKASNTGSNQEKAKLIYAIQAYGKNKRFGTYLRQDCGHRFDEAYLRKLSFSELEVELEKQEVSLSNKSNSSIIDTALKSGLTVAENVVCTKTKFNVSGTTEKLYEDDHYLDLLERVKMKYNMPFITLDPVMELALVIGQTAMLVHHQNQFSGSLKTDVDLDREINPEELAGIQN